MVDYTLIAIIIVLLVFIGWRDWQFAKVVDALTSKLMARDLPEYVRTRKDLSTDNKPQAKERRKVAVDPVLGAQF